MCDVTFPSTRLLQNIIVINNLVFNCHITKFCPCFIWTLSRECTYALLTFVTMLIIHQYIYIYMIFINVHNSKNIMVTCCQGIYITSKLESMVGRAMQTSFKQSLFAPWDTPPFGKVMVRLSQPHIYKRKDSKALYYHFFLSFFFHVTNVLLALCFVFLYHGCWWTLPHFWWA